MILAGPTGAGKTAVGIALARRLGGEILSADSRQVYRRLSAGTAKPAGEWRKTKNGLRYMAEGVAHHMVDHVEPTEVYTAGRFAREAEAVLTELSARGAPALVVGGTGLYLRALARGLSVLPERDPALRASLEALARERGRAHLHALLAEADPVSAGAIPANNLQRVVRALEVFRITGRALSAWHAQAPPPARSFAWFGLRVDPAAHRELLARRCGAMAPGILGETRSLLAAGVPADAPAFQSLGYREAMECLAGRCSQKEYEEAFFQQTLRYVKRQATWWRGEPSLRWVEGPAARTPDDVADDILRLMASQKQLQ